MPLKTTSLCLAAGFLLAGMAEATTFEPGLAGEFWD